MTNSKDSAKGSRQTLADGQQTLAQDGFLRPLVGREGLQTNGRQLGNGSGGSTKPNSATSQGFTPMAPAPKLPPLKGK
ncbi:Uncharacterised protein [Yersinia enterocolitica]|uniref:Uncharacterized protein n=2 Tax=root TaxID=1 RepID=A0AAE9FPZ5_9CAUD|nr:hypothetical protein [Yersinia enterocolitica]YP_010664331.1 hypothetical protein PQA68_gp16 [Yersinia phage vB_YenM_06.16-2]ELI8337091.1 hypothetical protein [Yersinia enterocolitica]UNA05860.1 hypothetical protein vBYenM06162_016 [Yersinia phage vB_YenM_06.16-2]CNG85822.1 Uncharacterised protein [Yersinia enterocolitica]HDM8412963.1 hypothetical protein [Yersinia enterocolitica]